MNKKELLDILKNFNFESFNFENDFEFSDLTTNLQFSNSDMGAIYRISDLKSEKLFKERLTGLSPAILILNKKPEFEISTPLLIVDLNENKNLLELILNKLYPLSDETPKLMGITGTNGKSTCVCLCEQILLQAGISSGTLGTIGITVNGDERDLGITGTTPSYVDLRRILKTLSSDIDYLFMEVSSHAIDQKRLGSLKLFSGAWTSFSQDHLDYHGSMEEYFSAKAKMIELFESEGTKLIVPPSQEELENNIKAYASKNNLKADIVRAKTLEEFGFKELPPFFRVHYNKDNLSLSLQMTESIADLKKIRLEALETPKGRFSVLEINESFAIVDYAHTPDAIENLVNATVKAFPGSKVITLFGCGGDRDKTKRPLMAQAAEKYSDQVIVTSDNPRSEAPLDIIEDIKAGLKKEPLLIEEDREKAIIEGVKNLNKGDVLIIAGKGHEEYQEVNGNKHFFSDFSVVKSIRD